MTAPTSFEVLTPSAPQRPVVVHVPHAGSAVPPDARRTLHLDDEALQDELLALTDHRTDVLASDVGELGATRFVNHVFRLVVDPERFPDDREELAARGMAAVYTHGARRQRIRADGPHDGLLGRYLDPYAAAFADLVGGMVDAHGRCTIVDLHSYPSRRLPYELHDGPRPQVCIGTDPVHTPPALADAVARVADAHGLEHARDTPFSGTYVPLDRYGTDPRVTSIMLEIRRDTYLDDATAEPHAGEVEVRRFVTDAVVAIATAASSPP